MISGNLNVNLNLMENRETRGILATDNITINQEVGDKLRNYITIPATNISASGCTFQTASLSKFIDGDNLFLEYSFSVIVAGKTVDPIYNATVGKCGGTPPYLFTLGVNAGVENMSLNKMINQLTVNISGRQYVENRIDNEVCGDLWAAQMDPKKLKAYGLTALKDQGFPTLRWLYGNGYVAHIDLANSNLLLNGSSPSVPEYAIESAAGFSSALQPGNQDDDNIGVWACQARYGYISAGPFGPAGSIQKNDVEFWMNSTPAYGGSQVPPANIIYNNKYYGAGSAIPTNGSGATLYSVSATQDMWLIQKQTITIREYLISNGFTASAYSKVESSRVYPSAGQLFSLTLGVNTNYMNQMIKILPPMMHNSFVATYPSPSTTASAGVNSQILSITPTAAQLSFYTFDSNKYLASDSLRTVYYELAKQQTSIPPIITPTSGPTTGYQMVSSTRTSLDNYMYIAMSSQIENNQNTYLTNLNSGNTFNIPFAGNMTASRIYHNITNLNLRYGVNSDIYMGANVDIKEAKNMTATLMGDPVLRREIFAQMRRRNAYSLFDSSDSGAVWSTNSVDWDDFRWGHSEQTGCSFLLLDLSKLNYVPIYDNQAVCANVNYGSQNFKNWVVTVDFVPNSTTFANAQTTASLQLSPLFYLINKWVRTMDLNSNTPYTQDPIEFSYLSVKNQISSFFEIVSEGSANATNELELIGGSFWSDLLSGVRKFAPIVSTLASAVGSIANSVGGAARSRGRPRRH